MTEESGNASQIWFVVFKSYGSRMVPWHDENGKVYRFSTRRQARAHASMLDVVSPLREREIKNREKNLP